MNTACKVQMGGGVANKASLWMHYSRKETEAIVMQFGQFGKAGPGILLYVIIS